MILVIPAIVLTTWWAYKVTVRIQQTGDEYLGSRALIGIANGAILYYMSGSLGVALVALVAALVLPAN